MDIVKSVIFYLILIIVVFWGSKSAYYSRKKINKRLFWFIMVAVPVLAGAFRENTGTDSLMYKMAYLNIDSVHRYQDFEMGFVWLIKILNFMHLPYQSLFFVCELLIVLFVFLFIEREKEYIDARVAVCIFMLNLYFATYNIMRQGVAIAMLLYAMSLYMDKKYVNCCIVIMIASLFHLSAIIGFAIVLGTFMFQSKYAKWYMMFAVCAILYLITHRDFLGKLVYLISKSSYYMAYVVGDVESESNLFVYIIKNLPIILILFLVVANKSSISRMRVYAAMAMCGFAFSALNIITATHVGRLGEYFTYLSIVVGAYFVKNRQFVTEKGKVYKLPEIGLKMLVIGYFFLFFLHQYMYKQYGQIVPYQGLWPIR